jgi:hypothetical protein
MAPAPGPPGQTQLVAGAESEDGQWKQACLLGLHGPRIKLNNSTSLCVILVSRINGDPIIKSEGVSYTPAPSPLVQSQLVPSAQCPEAGVNSGIGPAY